MGGYLVIVTDTDTKDPVSNAIVTLHADDTLSIRLPNSRLLDYADQTTVTVLLTKDKSAVEGMFVTMTDKHDNYCAGNTDSNGQVTVPGTSGKTNEDGNTTVGWEDEDGDRWTLTVTVEDYETGRPIEDAEVSIGKGGNITVTLPDGTDMDEDNRITVTVTDNERDPQGETHGSRRHRNRISRGLYCRLHRRHLRPGAQHEPERGGGHLCPPAL